MLESQAGQERGQVEVTRYDDEWKERAAYNSGALLHKKGKPKPTLSCANLRLSSWLIAGWNDADICLANARLLR
jgi:hypothetical protein